MNSFEIAVVIPIYNEEKIINHIIDELLKKLNNKSYILILVNDGSFDNTEKKLNKYNNINNIKIINKDNEGHGPTLIRGYYEAIKYNPKFVFQMDSDDQIPFDDFFKIYNSFKKENIVSGYRKNRKDPIARLVTTFILKICILIFHRVLIKDANIPFRIMKKDFLEKNIEIVKESKIPNVLLSILASKKKSHTQIPVNHKERFTGIVSIRKFKLFIFCIKSFIEVFKF